MSKVAHHIESRAKDSTLSPRIEYPNTSVLLPGSNHTSISCTGELILLKLVLKGLRFRTDSLRCGTTQATVAAVVAILFSTILAASSPPGDFEHGANHHAFGPAAQLRGS